MHKQTFANNCRDTNQCRQCLGRGTVSVECLLHCRVGELVVQLFPAVHLSVAGVSWQVGGGFPRVG